MHTQRSGLPRDPGASANAAAIVGVDLEPASADEDAGDSAVPVTSPTVDAELDEVPADAEDGVNPQPEAAVNQLQDIAGKRPAVLDRISGNIARVGGRAPAGLSALANRTRNKAEEIDRQNERLAKLAVKPGDGTNVIDNAVLGPLENDCGDRI